ncbi:hypothetical protein ABZ038_31595 [Streptomyces sp. NPDC006349]|uniref:hypothetical protein n=1 Tax=unclassified Streptomyces TaxID=2593676 RepID=UPI0033A22AEF
MSFLLDVRRLRVLAEFASHGTVAPAARALHLTDAGQRLVDHAHVLLGNLAAAESDLTALR